MKRLLSTVIASLLIGTASLSLAQVSASPTLVNFQGRLATPNGNPVPDGTYSIRFSLWDAATGGTEQWNQTIANVQVKNGTFAVLLNTNTARLFNANRWLEIKVGTDPALSPRQQLVSVPYALKANSVADGSITNNSIANGTLTNSKFVSGTFNTLAWLLGGNSGTSAASQFLGTTDAQPLVFKTNNAERLRIDSSGNVGIGVNTPTTALDVNGRIRSRGSDFVLNGRGGGLGFSGGAGRALVDSGDGSEIGYGGLVINFFNDYGKVWVDSPLLVNGYATFQGNIKMGIADVGEGLTAEVGGTKPILNLDVNFRHDTVNTTYPGAALRLDMRDGLPVMQFLSRDANSSTENLLYSVTRSGNFGIGNITPQTTLDVAGTARATSTATAGNYGYLGGSDYGIYGKSSSQYAIRGEIDGSADANNWAGVSGKDNTSGNFGQLGTKTLGAGGRSVVSGGTGVFGEVTNSGGVAGVHGVYTSNGNYGYLGAPGAGVFGSSQVGTAPGVAGYNNAGGTGVYASSSGTAVYANGNVVYTGTLTRSSDARYKTHIASLDNALDAVLNLRGVSYELRRSEFPQMNFGAGRQIGFIAQEVEKVLPELVQKDKDGYRSVDYVQVIPVLVEAVKTLKTGNDALKAKNAELETRQATLEARLNALEKLLDARNQK